MEDRVTGVTHGAGFLAVGSLERARSGDRRLELLSSRQRKFTEEERTLLLTLANQMALAIENAQLITNTAVVREMHHRIKNNLQTVAMLMQLQV